MRLNTQACKTITIEEKNSKFLLPISFENFDI